jgi:hypothetical protein
MFSRRHLAEFLVTEVTLLEMGTDRTIKGIVSWEAWRKKNKGRRKTP